MFDCLSLWFAWLKEKSGARVNWLIHSHKSIKWDNESHKVVLEEIMRVIFLLDRGKVG